MTLEQLVKLSDVYFIAKHKIELVQDYITISDIIFSDGTFSHHILPDGYIEITDLKNANFIVFADKNQEIFLGIYINILESKFKIIVDAIQSIKNQLNLVKNTTNTTEETESNIETQEEISQEEVIIRDVDTNQKDETTLLDIVDFACLDCGSTEMTPFKYNLMGDITTQCKHCKTIFTLTPSRYYVLKSRTSLADPSQYAIPKAVYNQLLHNSECDKYEY